MRLFLVLNYIDTPSSLNLFAISNHFLENDITPVSLINPYVCSVSYL